MLIVCNYAVITYSLGIDCLVRRHTLDNYDGLNLFKIFLFTDNYMKRKLFRLLGQPKTLSANKVVMLRTCMYITFYHGSSKVIYIGGGKLPMISYNNNNIHSNFISFWDIKAWNMIALNLAFQDHLRWNLTVPLDSPWMSSYWNFSDNVCSN